MNFNNNSYQEIDLDYCRANTSKRFANYLIDLVVFYIIMFCIGILIGIFNPSLVEGLDGIGGRLISLLFYGIIMFFTEAMSNGKSIGKLITGTKAVNLDGSDITFQKAFTRNLVRAIPFNVFSALGNPCAPWHDTWSDTLVIEEKKVALQKQQVDLFGEVRNQTL
ncbi:RDD family protein [Pedobacter sp. GSP4]|uniref:RDD family protein n=1 Tax=Pedobacter sp. GSP4 TaxID=3453716 RepID=UPI003EE98A83